MSLSPFKARRSHVLLALQSSTDTRTPVIALCQRACSNVYIFVSCLEGSETSTQHPSPQFCFISMARILKAALSAFGGHRITKTPKYRSTRNALHPVIHQPALSRDSPPFSAACLQGKRICALGERLCGHHRDLPQGKPIRLRFYSAQVCA